MKKESKTEHTVHPYIKHPHVAVDQPWSIPALCKAYRWPTGAPGGGVIAIVELGGGWVASDMAAYFQSIGQPMPSIVDVSVDGTTNVYSPDPQGADFEVALDIQVAAAAYYVATGQPANIRVYWAQTIAAAIVAAAKDGCAVFSCSWGADEANWAPSDIAATEAAAQSAQAAGMVMFAASGDNDSSDGGPNAANVDYPASSAYFVGCGGTSKPQGGPEVVWNNNPGQSNGEGTGGGFSTLFALPVYQKDIGVTPPVAKLGRGVPDCAANADPNTGDEVYVQGAMQVVGGTSAVSPLYAGLFAAFGPKLGSMPGSFYKYITDFVDVISGDNGAYKAGPGWDACTGLGTPIGTLLMFSLAGPIGPTPVPTPTPTPPAPPVMSKHELFVLVNMAMHNSYNNPKVSVEQMAINIEGPCEQVLSQVRYPSE